jgi:hypothetical protein
VADQNKFGNLPPQGSGPGALRCEEWEALLADALDGLLPARDAVAFEAHGAACEGCADLLAHAKQGQAWLEYLHTEPEVPSGLVSKILDKTVGSGAIPVQVIAETGVGVSAGAAAIPWRRSFQETRLLMTVAMTFFSIALTLNMAGFKLTNIRLADLQPSNLSHTISREFYGAEGSVVKFYSGLRFVYQLESKVRELRRDSSEPQQQQQQQPKKQEPSSRNGAGQNPGQQAQGSITNEKNTEAGKLSSLDTRTAGPRRSVDSAGCDGRSLA